MKIQEFRDKLKRCRVEELEKIASELYKMLPKNKKEEDADPLIERIISGKEIEKKQKTAEICDFDTLKTEINTFIENVDDDLYIKPNKIVPKDKRSKWRFEVKRFVKMLNEVPVDGENGAESARLLRELYKRLAYGCGYYIFSTDDPFRSVGITQTEFYEMLIKRTFATGFTDENIKNMLEDAAFVNLDRNSLQIELETIYAESLTTNDLKHKAIGFIKEYMDQRENEFKKTNKYSNNRYRLKCDIEELCETMLVLSLLLSEPDEAVDFYWKHDKERDTEITLYKILATIHAFGDEELWIRVYEDGIKRGIKPRDGLTDAYKKLRTMI